MNDRLWVNAGEVPKDEAAARAALEALNEGEALMYDEGEARVEYHGGIGGFGLSIITGQGWEGIDIGKSIESTLGDLRDDGCFALVVYTVTGLIPGDEPFVRVYRDEDSAHRYAQEQTAFGLIAYTSRDGAQVYDDGQGSEARVTTHTLS